jgi:hypothetical protein
LRPVLNALRRHASLVVIFLIAVIAGLATLQLRGAEAFMTALWHAWELFLFIVPSLVAGLLLAAALRQLLSPDALARLMGAESGIFGLFIATLVGTLSPGGPMATQPADEPDTPAASTPLSLKLLDEKQHRCAQA